MLGVGQNGSQMGFKAKIKTWMPKIEPRKQVRNQVYSEGKQAQIPQKHAKVSNIHIQSSK